MNLWRWLLNGSDELTLDKAWLANTERLNAYDAWTREQMQGYVTRTPDQLEAENARIVAEREQRLAQMTRSKVLQMPLRARGR